MMKIVEYAVALLAQAGGPLDDIDVALRSDLCAGENG